MDIGLLFDEGRKLLPLMPRIKKAVETFERYENDPTVKKILEVVGPASNEVQKIIADPDVKDLLDLLHEVATILSQK